MKTEILKINAGMLSSIGMLYKSISKGLKQFSDMHTNAINCNIEWDFRALGASSINMSALTSFLAIAKRVRKYTGQPQLTKFDWNPHVFSFLNDVNFFQIVRSNDLMHISDEVVNGFESNIFNPNTKIIMLPHEKHPLKDDNIEDWKYWKDEKRHEYKTDIITKCYKLFDKIDDSKDFGLAKDVISKTCAELALNSIMWGNEDAFIGLQRSSRGISICVADCGIGFKQSLINKKHKKELSDIDDSLEALIIGSLINDEEFGLRRAIDEVIKFNGWIQMSSYDAELLWGADIWNTVNNIELYNDNISVYCKKVRTIVEDKTSMIEYYERRTKGYCRIHERPIRGSRISFEIPFRNVRR